MEPTIRPFTPADRPAGHAMRVDSFSSAGAADYPEDGEPYIADHRRLGAVDAEGRLLGQAGAWDFGQWFLGRRLPMAGVAGVTIQPDARRQGLAARLMTELLRTCLDQGDVIATLDPTAPEVYRRLGFANAGVWVTRTLPTALLQDLPASTDPPAIRLFRWEEDVEATTTLWREEAARHHGRLDRSPTHMRRHLEPDADQRIWLAERGEQLVGMVTVEKQPAPTGDRSVFEQVVGGLVAQDRQAWLALWRMVGAQSSVCQSTILLSRPHEPLLDEISAAHHHQTQRMKTWMSRILDVQAAVQARGWPSVDVTIPVRILDPLISRNNDEWVLRVKDGEGSLEQGTGRAGPTMEIGAFSALFTGHASAATLAWQERLSGATASDLAALDAAFCSPQPYLHDHF